MRRIWQDRKASISRVGRKGLPDLFVSSATHVIDFIHNFCMQEMQDGNSHFWLDLPVLVLQLLLICEAQEEMCLWRAEDGALWHLEAVEWNVEKAMQKWLGPTDEAMTGSAKVIKRHFYSKKRRQ